MIKICTACDSTWAGGRFCEDCGAALRDPFGDDAKQLQSRMWSYIRLQYGARRGMLVRVMAILLGPVVFVVALRTAVGLARPYSLVLAIASVPLGVLTWWTIHWLAGKAVRIWVLRKGQVHKRRLAMALVRRTLGRRSGR